jgi:hypothetical protein
MIWSKAKNGWLLPVEVTKVEDTDQENKLVHEEKELNPTAGTKNGPPRGGNLPSTGDAAGNHDLAGNRIGTGDGKTGLRSEVARCFWDGKIYLIKDFAECSLTKVKVYRGHLNEKSELIAVRQFLSRAIQGELVSNEICVKLRANQLLQEVNSATARRLMAPSKAAYILKYIERKPLNVRLNMAVIISTKDNGERLKGRLIVVEKKK